VLGLVTFLIQQLGQLPTPSGMIVVVYIVGGPPALLAGVIFGMYKGLMRKKHIAVGTIHSMMAGWIIGACSTAIALLTAYSQLDIDIAKLALIGAAAGALCGLLCALTDKRF